MMITVIMLLLVMMIAWVLIARIGTAGRGGKG